MHCLQNENIYNHLTAKVIEPNGSESFLINPFGLKYGEITASSLVRWPGSKKRVFSMQSLTLLLIG